MNPHYINFVQTLKLLKLKLFDSLLRVLLVLYVLSQIIQGSPARTSSSCANVTLQERTDYCNISLSTANCYVDKAIEYRLQRPEQYFPVWVHLCVFAVPDFFRRHENFYLCSVSQETGLVHCLLKNNPPDGISNFARNCSVALMWQEKQSSPIEQIKNLVTRNCSSHFKSILSSSNDTAVTNRYLFDRDVEFNNISKWQWIEKNVPSGLTTAMIALCVIGACGMLVGISYCMFTITKKWKRFAGNDINLNNDIVINRLESILTVTDGKDPTYSYQGETVDSLTLNN